MADDIIEPFLDQAMHYSYDDTGERQAVLRQLTRVVIKVGTRLLTDIDDQSKTERVEQLVAALARLRERGLDVVLVSSGAIGAGMAVLGTEQRPTALAELQAHAAVGQCRLMSLYETACVKHGFHCAQLLLTAADVQSRGRHVNVMSCASDLLARGVLPIVNENDSVSVEEIRFGDNDVLAALVATMIRADLTVLLTTVNGMHDGNQAVPPQRLSVVNQVSEEIKEMASGTDGNRFSVGGMITKLRAAELVTRAGEGLWIADGTDFSILDRIIAGEDVGTLFPAGSDTRMRSHKRYLAFFAEHRGDLIIDAGAEKAVVEQGRSLLPSGITQIIGDFVRGDTIRILNTDGVELGRGVTNYSSENVALIKGRKSGDIRAILGYDACDDVVVHRSYLVLTSTNS